MVAFVAVDSVSELSRQLMSLSLGVYLEYLGLRAVAFQVYVVPLAALLALLLCFSRMSREGEALGLEVSGIGRRRIARPGILFAVCLALVSLVAQERLSVAAGQRSAMLLSRLRDGGGVVLKGLSSGPEILPDGKERIMVAHSLDMSRQQLNGVFLHLFFEGRRVQEWYAETASWGERGWTMRKVRKLDFDPHQERAAETSMAELRSVVDLLGAIPEPAGLLAGKRELQSLQSLFGRLATLPSGEGSLRQERRMLRLEIARRLALPFSTLVFALLAIPFGFRSQKNGLGACLGATVAVALVYYVLSSLTLSLGEAGRLPVFLAAWLANLVFGALGALWLWRQGG